MKYLTSANGRLWAPPWRPNELTSHFAKYNFTWSCHFNKISIPLVFRRRLATVQSSADLNIHTTELDKLLPTNKVDLLPWSTKAAKFEKKNGFFFFSSSESPKSPDKSLR